MHDIQVDDQNSQKVEIHICAAQKGMKENPLLRRERTFELDNSNTIFSKELKELNNENRKSMAVNLAIQVSESGNKKDITELTKAGWMLEGSRTSSGTKTSSTSELG